MRKQWIIGAVVVLSGLSLLLLTPAVGKQTAPSTTTAFGVERLTCGACSENIRQALEQQQGVYDVQTDVGQGRTVVRYDAQRISPARIAAAITAAGYPATPMSDDAPQRLAANSQGGCGGGCCGKRNN